MNIIIDSYVYLPWTQIKWTYVLTSHSIFGYHKSFNILFPSVCPPNSYVHSIYTNLSVLTYLYEPIETRADAHTHTSMLVLSVLVICLALPPLTTFTFCTSQTYVHMPLELLSRLRRLSYDSVWEHIVCSKSFWLCFSLLPQPSIWNISKMLTCTHTRASICRANTHTLAGLHTNLHSHISCRPAAARSLAGPLGEAPIE